MKNRLSGLNLSALGFAACALLMPLSSQAQTEIQWWHSMTAVNGEWVNDLAKEFNASQTAYKIVPTYKGQYDESMAAAIAAFRAGNAPHILQVFEVGTATMMASKGAIVPVTKVMQDGGTDLMIFDIPYMLAHASQALELNPGDLLTTGSPGGSGIEHKPPVWMKPGDTLEVEISKIGVLKNPVVAE